MSQPNSKNATFGLLVSCVSWFVAFLVFHHPICSSLLLRYRCFMLKCMKHHLNHLLILSWIVLMIQHMDLQVDWMYPSYWQIINSPIHQSKPPQPHHRHKSNTTHHTLHYYSNAHLKFGQSRLEPNRERLAMQMRCDADVHSDSVFMRCGCGY